MGVDERNPQQIQEEVLQAFQEEHPSYQEEVFQIHLEVLPLDNSLDATK